MPLFHVSARAQKRNENVVAAVYFALLVLLVGGFALAVIGGLAYRIYDAF